MSDFHISWTQEGAALPQEEQNKIAEKLKQQISELSQQRDMAQQALQGLPYVAVPIDQLADIYKRLSILIKLGQATIDEWMAMSEEVANLRRAIFAQADFGALYAGQWLPKNIRDEISMSCNIDDLSNKRLPRNDK